MKAKLTYKKKEFTIDLKKCKGIKKGFGLMFTSKKRAKPLLFEFKKPARTSIHSWFVSFPFVAIWLDENNKVLDYEVVYPFRSRVMPSVKYTKLIEVPLTSKYAVIMKFLVDHRKV